MTVVWWLWWIVQGLYVCAIGVRFGCVWGVSDTWPLVSARTPSAFFRRAEAGIDESFKLTMSL